MLDPLVFIRLLVLLLILCVNVNFSYLLNLFLHVYVYDSLVHYLSEVYDYISSPQVLFRF